MLQRRRTIAVGVLGCLLTAASGASVAQGEVLGDRWASPTGSATAACTQVDPCDIVTAINGAEATSVIHVESGTYGSSDAPLTTQLEADHPVTIGAATPADPPVIIADASGGSALLTYDSVVTDLVIKSSSPTSGLSLLDHSSASRIAVYATGGVSAACVVSDSTLSDSVCSQTAAGSAGVELTTAGTGTTTDTVSNVTAVSTGVHGVGIDSRATGGVEFDPGIKNSILQGKQHDLLVGAAAGATSVVASDHSLYRPAKVATNGATFTAGASDVAGRAKFAAVGDADFHEAHTSRSVDAGGQVEASDTDLAGYPRTLGKAPDIGAYEFLPRPHVSRLKLTTLVRRTATFSVSVNPGGLDTTLQLVARHKLHKVTSHVVDVGNGRTPRKLALSIVLDPDTKYHVRARASSQAGVTQSNNTHLMT